LARPREDHLTDPAALALSDLTLRLGERDVVRAVSLSVARGRRLAVVGRSGAGKTSLLRLVAGLTAPSSGQVTLEGELASEAGRVVLAPQARGVGLVFQDLALWPHMSVEETLAFVADGTRAERRQAARRWAARVGLGGRLDARPGALSGGERQRLALARSLLPAPRLLLLDEPFAHLDAPLREELAAALEELVTAAGATLVLVTHQRREVLDLAQDVAVLRAGALVEAGALPEVLEQPAHAETVSLLGLGAAVPGTPVEGGLETALGRLALRGAADAEAALVRPQDVALAAPGAGVAGRVVRCRVGRPEATAGRFDVVVAAGEVTVRARSDGPRHPGEEVGVILAPGPFPGLRTHGDAPSPPV